MRNISIFYEINYRVLVVYNMIDVSNTILKT